MVHVETSELYKNKYVFLWSMLSFKAGLLNAAGFLIAGSFVSHVTGFGTHVGIAFGHEEYTFGTELLVIPVTFIGGALLTSLILDKNYSKANIPNYPIVQLLITALIGIISLCFSFGFLDVASLGGKDEKSIFLIAMLCLVCGLKNGLTTWASHGKIRTTHLTGLSTDIGLHLPKIFRPEGANSRYPEPRKVTWVRIITLISFSIGSFLAAFLIPAISYKIFYLSFFISLIFSITSIVHRKNLLSAKESSTKGALYAHAN